LRFLGSVAFNGGLPMQLLATARGNIGRVLSRVLRLAGTGSADAADINGWIESLAVLLPQAYRQSEIFVLLTEVILTVLRLKHAARLSSAKGAVAELDLWNSQWRTQFPFPVEDEHAQGLLEQLIRDAAEVRPAPVKARFTVERRLELAENGSWQVRAEVDIPEYIHAKDLATLFSADVGSLPRLLRLRIARGTVAVEMPVRRLAGQERYRIERVPSESRHADAVAEHALLLFAPDGATWHATPAKGSAVDDDLPWTFEATSDHSQSFRLVRQGSGAVSARLCWVCFPSAWRSHADEGSECRTIGSVPELRRSIVELRGSARLEDQAGQSYRVRSGQAGAGEENLELRGDRLWDGFVTPGLAFRGFPRLYRVSDDGFAQPASGQIAWRVEQQRSTVAPSMLGPLEAMWPAVNDVKWRSRLLVLPADSSELLEPGKSPSKGRIQLVNWQAATARSLTDGVLCSQSRDSRTLTADLECKDPTPPEWVDLELTWQGNPRSCVARFTYPASGARAFDASGSPLPNGALISADKLPGIRLVAFLASTRRAQLDLKTANSAGELGRFSISREIRASGNSVRLEIRLLDYATDIQRLLAHSDGLDAAVTVSFRPANGTGVSVRISRYAAGLDRGDDSRSVTLDAAVCERLTVEQLRAVEINALRLDQPAEEPVALAQDYTQGVPTGRWKLDVARLTPGPWLVYPRPTSALKFRPLLWPVPGVEGGTGKLSKALRLHDQSERSKALDAVIEALSTDFDDDDWLTIELLIGHLGQLPLPALDLWRRFAKSSRGMAALALRAGRLPVELVGRFATELPFLWELVPFGAWRHGIAATRQQCIKWLGEAPGETFFEDHIERRIQAFTASNHSLYALLGSARVSATGRVTADFQRLRQPAMDAFFAHLLFHGDNCALQQVLRNNAEREWPGGLSAEVGAARRSSVWARYLCPSEQSFRDSVINAPILLALHAVSGTNADWITSSDTLALLRGHQAFDPEWFAEAFNSTVLRCLGSGLLQCEV
jgi:hypothetical protein